MTKDWRLEHLETQLYLRGVTFTRKPYHARRPDWNHYDCVACWVTLAEIGVEGAEIVHEGYATTAAFIRGAEYEWVCVPCFEQFRNIMSWTDEGILGTMHLERQRMNIFSRLKWRAIGRSIIGSLDLSEIILDGHNAFCD